MNKIWSNIFATCHSVPSLNFVMLELGLDKDGHVVGVRDQAPYQVELTSEPKKHRRMTPVEIIARIAQCRLCSELHSDAHPEGNMGYMGGFAGCRVGLEK